jgi:hypothetical protein
METGKYISLAGKLSLLLVVTTLAEIHLIREEIINDHILVMARDQAADWFYYNANLNPFMAALAFDDRKIITPQEHVPSYYDGIGWIDIQQSSKGVHLKIGASNSDDLVEATVLQLHPWNRVLPLDHYKMLTRLLGDDDLRSLSKIQQHIMQSAEVQQAVKKGLLHPSYTVDPRVEKLVYEQYKRDIQLAAIAAQMHLALPPDDREKHATQPDQDTWGAHVYQLIEQHYFERTINVPAVDLQLKPLEATTALSLISLSLLICLISCLAAVKQNSSAIGSEPWLILDAKGGLPIALAIIWSAVAVLSAPISGLLTIALLARNHMVDGLPFSKSEGFLVAFGVLIGSHPTFGS